MKKCSWYLWLNGKKIYDIRQLRENFDTAALIGYFLGGSLIGWLRDVGENDILDRLSDIDLNGDIGSQLEFAFGVVPDKKSLPNEYLLPQRSPAPPHVSIPAQQAADAGITEVPLFTAQDSTNAVVTGEGANSFGTVSSYNGGIGSFYGAENSSGAAYYAFSAFGQAGSFSSFNASSYNAFVTGQALNISSSFYGSSFGGSFTNAFGNFGLSSGMWYSSSFFGILGAGGSFTGLGYGGLGSLGSFNIGLLGSFSLGAYTFGSYKGVYFGSFGLWQLGSFTYRLLSGGYGSFGSFGSMGNFGRPESFYSESGSYRSSVSDVTITADEYRRTMINLTSCPLNAYGYGINLI